MTFFLSRLLARWVLSRGWLLPVAVVVFVFATSWPLMALAEPAGSDLVRPGNYWWYFVVTAATVGYGDYSPESVAGHFVGGYVIIGGIATLTTVFTRLATALEQAKGRRMQGTEPVHTTGHTVLIGYTAGRTERIVAQLLADGVTGLVLCTGEEIPVHPCPGSQWTSSAASRRPPACSPARPCTARRPFWWTWPTTTRRWPSR
ncbi:potassium channel family protein [Amycolatopsis sp. NPDC051371]|uniref:potassium channel family protein n=1 Tax=Amycolatopsis sp. NPDC051371 TaxID=3155800 RepID=UPI0034319C39